MKKGITVAILVVLVAVLGILATVTVTSISNSYANSKLSIWVTEIVFVQDLMKENKNNISNVLMDTISFDVSSVDADIKTEQFEGETITSNKITLKEINLAAIGVDNALYGIHKDALDIYAYSETTGKVYYLKGMDTRVSKYYTLTKELKNRYGDNLTVSNLSLISFEQSEIAETANAIQVTVKVPKSYTNVTVTTSNSSITVGSKVTEEDKYTYLVNTNNIKSNYVITVGYTENGTSKSITHTVDNLYTLGKLVKGPEDYGKTVDYTANGISAWRVYYEDETNGYVFLISTNTVTSRTLSSTTTPTTAINTKYKIFKLGKTAYTLTSSYTNSKAVATLVNGYSAYANTSTYGSNVVAAIGGPTPELFVAGWNAKGYSPTLSLTTSTYGYKINSANYVSGLTNDGLYVTSSVVWLAAPSAYSSSYVMSIGGGQTYYYTYSSTKYIRPVVCLKSDTPAVIGTTTDYSLVIN